jgi:hypothetical protein
VRSSLHDPYTQVIYTHAHMGARLSRIPPYRYATLRNRTHHAQTRPTSTHSCEQAVYCAHVSIWSGQVLQQCASPLVAYGVVPKAVRTRVGQRTCVARDARSHTHNSHTPTHTCMPSTNTHVFLTFMPSSTWALSAFLSRSDDRRSGTASARVFGSVART